MATKAGKTISLVPKLRFPEFHDAPNWNAINGNELFDLIDRRPARTGLPILAITQEHGAVPRDQIDYHVSVSETSIASYKEVQPADFIISLRSFQGGIEYSRFHGICSPAYLILKRTGEGDDHYFRHLFKSDRFIQQLTRNIEGLRDGKMISYKQFSEQLIPTPPPAEQRTIAACLTLLDALIAARGRKLAALAAHKKGLMQQLFPRPGEPLPRLRFPEFRKEGEWEEKRLEEIADFQSGGTPSKSNPAFWNGTIPWVSAKDMKRMVLEDTEDHITDEAVEDGARVVPAGTVLILTRGMTLLKDIPICLVACPMALNQDVRALRPINGFDGLFLAYMLVGNKERIRIMVDIAGHGTGRLNTNRLKTLGLHLPPPAEQQRIAACLGSLDAALAAEAQALSALRTHKKGLMQQLFPSPEGD